MKGVFILLGALLLIILSPFAISSVHDARVTTYEESFTTITTAAGVTSANVTLSLDLFANSIANVTSETSNISGDLPSSSNYTSAIDRLTVGGLLASSTRTLVIEYEIANPDLAEDLPSMDAILLVTIFLYFIMILGLIAAAIWSYFKG